jgi:hypothetical protein
MSALAKTRFGIRCSLGKRRKRGFRYGSVNHLSLLVGELWIRNTELHVLCPKEPS